MTRKRLPRPEAESRPAIVAKPSPPPINDLLSDLVPPDEVDAFADPVKARKKAMDYLARREYGREELEAKLTTAGFDAAVAADAVDSLAADGLQCDRRFAEAFVLSRVRRGKGPVRIRVELRERGIGDSLVAEALEAAETDWRRLAIDTRRRKFGDDVPKDFADKARQMRFLQYRGFETDQIQAAVSDDD